MVTGWSHGHPGMVTGWSRDGMVTGWSSRCGHGVVTWAARGRQFRVSPGFCVAVCTQLEKEEYSSRLELSLPMRKMQPIHVVP